MALNSPVISLSSARDALSRAVDKCESLRQAGSFIVVDASGAPVSAVRMDGCAPAALPLVRAKAYGAAANGEPSERFAARMAKFGTSIFASYQAVLRDQPFPGAGGVPIMENGRAIGAMATGLGIGPFVKLAGIDPSQLIANGKPANLEDIIISYALDVPYSPQHGDDLARWTEAYGSLPDSAINGSAMDPAPTASKQAILDKARLLADRAIELATQDSVRVSVVISDAAGDVVLLDRMDGASPMGVDIAAATATAAVNFGLPSSQIGSQQHYTGGALEALLELVPYRMLALPGGCPIAIGGQVVGAVGLHCSDLDRAHAVSQDVADYGASIFQGDNS